MNFPGVLGLLPPGRTTAQVSATTAQHSRPVVNAGVAGFGFSPSGNQARGLHGRRVSVGEYT
jgi:hypothetical protein